ncbi:MAG: hypothetical protein KGL35_11405, partial [Bradyrhizobium sp.]|nr:hypothetical protein [Bradyrhizobium sp.]
MSSILSSLTDLTKDKGGEAIAFGLGFALGHVLDPPATALSQESWLLALSATSALGKALDPGQAAEAVAEDIQSLDWGKHEAAQTGIAADNFVTLVDLTLSGVGLPDLITLRRRDEITDADFIHGLRKLKLEPRWDAPLQTLQDEKLNVAVVATAIQRGLMRNAGILPVGAPTGEGKVPPMPVSDLDPIVEAAATGYDAEHLKILSRIVGLPASPDQAARLVFRNIIDRVDFDRAISEGNTRNEWAPFMFEGFREILTAHNYVEARLRGWIDDTEMYAGTALHGMTQADTDLL